MSAAHFASDTAAPWMREAACAGVDPTLFYPDGNNPHATREGLAVCARCPVREACLEWALRNGERHGTWGGKSENQRKRLIRSLRDSGALPTRPPVRCGTTGGYERHYRLGETACDECRQAKTEAARAYRRRKGAA